MVAGCNSAIGGKLFDNLQWEEEHLLNAANKHVQAPYAIPGYGTLCYTWIWHPMLYLDMVPYAIPGYGTLCYTWIWYPMLYLDMVPYGIAGYGTLCYTWIWYPMLYLDMVYLNMAALYMY